MIKPQRAAKLSGLKIQFHRFLVLPLVLWVVFFSVVVVFTMEQRKFAINDLQTRTQLQAGLLAEKIAGKLNTLELLLLMLEDRASSLDLSNPSDLRKLDDYIRSNLYVYGEMDGLCVIDLSGNKLFTTYHMDSPELTTMRNTVLELHVKQGISFYLTPLWQADSRNLVLSRSLLNTKDELVAVVMVLVRSDSFFNEYDLSQVTGLAEVLLYDQKGDIHALWVNAANSSVDPAALANLRDMPGCTESGSLEADDTKIVGGSHAILVDNNLLCSMQLSGYPLYIGVRSVISVAMRLWDVSSLLNLLILGGVILVSLIISLRLGFLTAVKDNLQKEMMYDLETKVQTRTLELHQAVSDLERVSELDSLTGVFTRRKLNTLLEREIDRANRSSAIFSIIVMDLDEFKRVNDTYGHLVGDEVLKHIVKLLKDRIGESGILCRWGGDELLVLLPGSGLEKSLAVAESLRSVVQEYPYSPVIVVTMSLGVAQFLGGESVTGLIRRADNALYHAKAHGKNKVSARHESDRISP
jgi:diguanylate cyclase (GGDEF)-like protein